MGWFSSKTKYYVAGQVYNMAGDMADRPNHMKTLIVQSAMVGDDIAMRIRNGLISGPGSNLQQFQKWANTRYRMGLPTADITGDEIASLTPVRDAIPIPSGSPIGTTATVLNAVLTEADAQYWVEDYLNRNHPNLLELEWVYEQDDVSDQITISFAGNQPDITFSPSNWVAGANYVAARYVLNYPAYNDALVNTGVRGPFRSLAGCGVSGYTLLSSTPQPEVTVALDRREVRVIDYMDTRPSVRTETTTTQNVVTTPVRHQYRWDEQKGYVRGTNRPWILRHNKGVTVSQIKRTTTTRETIPYLDRMETVTIYQDVLVDSFVYGSSQQNRYGVEISPQRMFLYRIGSGNVALDNLKVRRTTQREFFPIMPLRIDNRFIDEPEFTESAYEPVSKAYKKAFNDDIDKLLDELKDNESIDDLDYAFMVFGVTLNEMDNSGRKYIYEFFKGLMSNQLSSKSEWLGYQQSSRGQNSVARVADLFERNMRNNLRVDDSTRPALPQYPAPRRSEFILTQSIPGVNNYRITIAWSYIAETIHSGKGRPGAKRNDLWFATTTEREVGADNIVEFIRDVIKNDENKVLYMYHQTGPLTYRRLEIVGMVHSNLVYKNKSVVSWAYDNHKGAEESPFFVPLHLPTLRKLNKKDQNQLAYCSRLLVLNSYQKVKVRWYQRGIFKVVFTIALIAASFVIMGPAGLAAAPGVLGTNIAVGTALGLAGTAAIIAGAVANMIAGMIITSIISKVSVEAFGDKFGHMIAAVASFFALQVGANFASTGSMQMNWNVMFSPQNLTKLTQVVSNGYQGFVQGRMTEILGDYEAVADQYKDELKVIEERMNELYGNNAWIDPTLMAEMDEVRDMNFRESSDSFLQRTLLTGTDIAELSVAMISEFPSISIKLPNAIM